MDGTGGWGRLTGKPGLRRHHTAPGTRLFELSREHDKLSREIRHKHQRLLEVRALRSALDTQLALELGPLQRRVSGLVKECRTLFERVLGAESELSRSTKVAVRTCYVEFGADFAWLGEAQASSTENPVRDKSNSTQSAHKPHPERERTLHAVFRRLVVALHPDKVQASEEKDARTALLKEVTQAYETLDVVRLLELERVHLAQALLQEDEQYTNRRIQELTASNAELRRQLKVVSRQVREARGGLLDAATPEATSAEVTTQAMASQVVATWRALTTRLDLTRHLLQDLAQGKPSALGFLNGSWRAATTQEIDQTLVFNERAVPTTPHQVDENNVEGVLDAFKAHLERTRNKPR